MRAFVFLIFATTQGVVARLPSSHSVINAEKIPPRELMTASDKVLEAKRNESSVHMKSQQVPQPYNDRLALHYCMRGARPVFGTHLVMQMGDIKKVFDSDLCLAATGRCDFHQQPAVVRFCQTKLPTGIEDRTLMTAEDLCTSMSENGYLQRSAAPSVGYVAAAFWVVVHWLM